jgi:hypothetical protein
MYALTILTYDSDFSEKNRKTDWLLEMHRMLLQGLQTQFGATQPPIEIEISAVALYFENLNRLPEETKKSILGRKRLQSFKAYKPSGASHYHQIISEGLRSKLAANKKDFIVVDEVSGLDSEILPIDITIKDKTGKRIIAFIEIDGLQHFITTEDGQKIPRRRDQLKEELYKFNHPRIRLLRINLLDQRPYSEYVEELYEKIVVDSIFSQISFKGKLKKLI